MIILEFYFIEKYERIFQCGQTQRNDDNICIAAAWTKNRCDFQQIIEINRLRTSGQHADVSYVLATYFHTGVAQKVSRLLKCSYAFSDWCTTSINEGKFASEASWFPDSVMRQLTTFIFQSYHKLERNRKKIGKLGIDKVGKIQFKENGNVGKNQIRKKKLK